MIEKVDITEKTIVITITGSREERIRRVGSIKDKMKHAVLERMDGKPIEIETATTTQLYITIKDLAEIQLVRALLQI